MRIIKNMCNKTLIKQIFLLLITASIVICSSCSYEGDEVLFSYKDKTITKAIYNCYYSRNKENIVETYKGYYQSYGESFRALYGFLPDGSDEYWETTFWNEKPINSDKTMQQELEESTIKACKEYLVYEQIAKDYNYGGLPESITEQFEKLKTESINTYGSFEAWNIATIGQYGITADELMKISTISSYGTVLPQFIFGENFEKISNEEATSSLSEHVQIMYSVYYYQSEEIEENVSGEESSTDDYLSEETPSVDTSSSEDVSNDTVSDDIVSNDSASSENESVEDLSSSDETSKEESENSEIPETAQEYNKYYRELMYSNYEKVQNGEKNFEEIYKDSDDYPYLSQAAPNGVVLKKTDFKETFSIDVSSFKSGDIIITENDMGIFLIKFVDFSEDYINVAKLYLGNEKFQEILDSYISQIDVNEKLLSTLTAVKK